MTAQGAFFRHRLRWNGDGLNLASVRLHCWLPPSVQDSTRRCLEDSVIACEGGYSGTRWEMRAPHLRVASIGTIVELGMHALALSASGHGLSWCVQAVPPIHTALTREVASAM
jgi:hypothetical protein